MRFRRSVVLAASVLGASAAHAQTVDEMMLSAAARECRTSDLGPLIKKGVDVDSRNSGGYTPLMLAAGNGCVEAVHVLLEAGADVSIVHASFGDAAAQAKMHGQQEVHALLERARTPQSVASVGTRPGQTEPSRESSQGAEPGTAVTGGHTQWPAIGAYKVGQQVIYSGSGGKTWQTGVIKSIDPKYGYSIVDGPSGSYSNYFVVGPQREPFWTSYFLGDWRVSVPVAMGLATDGRTVYRTVSGGLRLPPLRIGADGTYSWRVQKGGGEELIRGRWEPNPRGPGVILKNAERGADWLVYNNTDALSTAGDTVIISSDCCTHYDGTRIK